DKRTFKLFTFSPLIPVGHRRWEMNGDGTMTTEARNVSLLISSGKAEFVEHLVVGLLHQPLVQIGRQRFRVETVKKLDPPELGDDMQFIMLSPLVCSAKRHGEKYPQYLMPGDEGFERVLLENLLGKYEALHGQAYEGKSELHFEVAKEYFERKQGKITKLITLKEGSPDETKVRGTLAPFRLCVQKELMEVGYYCGFGGLNAQGFGMVKG
ncbi:MAG: CRISPR-associated endoribonuclease Cas6, partial [Ignavibacteriaceae bacterium]|nr:CRISPR-associated endoribonuclease Cas6 [Ignavibacteriaceae bacterium]